MFKSSVPWTFRDAISVHVLRLAIGFVLIRIIYPKFFSASQFTVEVTDRVVIIGLVWLMIRRHHTILRDWGLSTENLGRNMLIGVFAGMLLLGVSLFSERLFTTMLFVTPSQHPLVAMIRDAVSWQHLIIPLFLAGILAPFSEEILYRLCTFSPLVPQLGVWRSALASALIFAFFHFNLYWLPEMLVVGMGLALLYYRTGSLVSAITAHAFINSSKIVILYLGLPFV